MRTRTRSAGAGVALAAACLVAQTAQAQRLAGEQLIDAIQDGGYYLVMNPAASAVPTGGGGGRGGAGFGGRGGGGGGGGAAPGGGGRGAPGGGRGFGGGAPGGPGGGPAPQREEELTQESIGLLTGARHAFVAFDLTLDDIYTSPARRAVQQADELPFADIMQVPELGEGQSPEWLARKVREPHAAGSNTLIVTDASIITGALDISNVDEGETLVVRPGGEVIGRLDLRDWSVLAVELTDFP